MCVEMIACLNLLIFLNLCRMSTKEKGSFKNLLKKQLKILTLTIHSLVEKPLKFIIPTYSRFIRHNLKRGKSGVERSEGRDHGVPKAWFTYYRWTHGVVGWCPGDRQRPLIRSPRRWQDEIVIRFGPTLRRKVRSRTKGKCIVASDVKTSDDLANKRIKNKQTPLHFHNALAFLSRNHNVCFYLAHLDSTTIAVCKESFSSILTNIFKQSRF